jgi:hypothetical protein
MMMLLEDFLARGRTVLIAGNYPVDVERARDRGLALKACGSPGA